MKMLRKILNIKIEDKEKYFYIFTFILLSVSILTNSFTDTNGFLTTDSTHFLKFAKNFNLNKSFYLYSWTNSGEINFFSMWPLGYPLLVSFLSSLTTLDVFWSSKLLNILCILTIFLIIYRKTPYGYSFIGFFFLAGSFLNIFSYTLTENLFIVGLISYAYSTHNITNSSGRINVILGFISFIIAFSSRYIGGYLIIFNLFLILRSLRSKSPNLKYFFILFTLCGIYMCSYLYMNKHFTGFFTYPHAYLTYESSVDIILQFIKKIFEELNFIMASVRLSSYPFFSILSSVLSATFIFLGIFYIRKTKVRETRMNQLGNNFIHLALFYLLIVLLWRLTIWFSPFSYRILFPSSILFLIGFGYKILSRSNFSFPNIKGIYLLLILLGSLSFGYNILYKQISFSGITYSVNIENIKGKHISLKKGDGIIFGDRHLDYLRVDLVPLKPYYLPLFSKIETINDFNLRIKKLDNKYIDIPPICEKPYQTLSGDRDLNCISLNKKIHNFDSRIMDYLEKNKDLGLHKIREIK